MNITIAEAVGTAVNAGTANAADTQSTKTADTKSSSPSVDNADPGTAYSSISKDGDTLTISSAGSS